MIRNKKVLALSSQEVDYSDDEENKKMTSRSIFSTPDLLSENSNDKGSSSFYCIEGLT
jgi:hypothetical protein